MVQKQFSNHLQIIWFVDEYLAETVLNSISEGYEAERLGEVKFDYNLTDWGTAFVMHVRIIYKKHFNLLIEPRHCFKSRDYTYFSIHYS